jgi:hypothetical protein
MQALNMLLLYDVAYNNQHNSATQLMQNQTCTGFCHATMRRNQTEHQPLRCHAMPKGFEPVHLLTQNFFFNA